MMQGMTVSNIKQHIKIEKQIENEFFVRCGSVQGILWESSGIWIPVVVESGETNVEPTDRFFSWGKRRVAGSAIPQ